MKYNDQSIVGQIVANDYRAASVFKNSGIDFCCQGNRTLEDACTKAGMNSSELLESLEQINIPVKSNEANYDSWPLDLLADYVEKKHHRYVNQKSVEIKPFLDKICLVHGKAHPELIEIKKEFEESVGELAMHMKKEELILFPIIRKLVAAENEGGKMPQAAFGSVGNPIAKMQEEHEQEGERFRRISTLSNSYTPPEDACATYKVTFAMLQEFEEDLHLHIHIENNILFPKAIGLEKRFV